MDEVKATTSILPSDCDWGSQPVRRGSHGCPALTAEGRARGARNAQAGTVKEAHTAGRPRSDTGWRLADMHGRLRGCVRPAAWLRILTTSSATHLAGS